MSAVGHPLLAGSCRRGPRSSSMPGLTARLYPLSRPIHEVYCWPGPLEFEVGRLDASGPSSEAVGEDDEVDQRRNQDLCDRSSKPNDCRHPAVIESPRATHREEITDRQPEDHPREASFPCSPQLGVHGTPLIRGSPQSPSERPSRIGPGSRVPRLIASLVRRSMVSVRSAAGTVRSEPAPRGPPFQCPHTEPTAIRPWP